MGDTCRRTPVTEASVRRTEAFLHVGAEMRRPGCSPRVDQETYTGGPISTELRINDRIRVPEVRLVGPNGETVGIVPTDQALKLAQEADLDLALLPAGAVSAATRARGTVLVDRLVG